MIPSPKKGSTNGKTQLINPPPPTHHHKLFFLTQISLRVLAFAATLVAGSIIFSTKQTAPVFGIQFHATYSYSPAFKFFAYVNLIVCFITAISLVTVIKLARKTIDSSHYFHLFFHDLLMAILLSAGCATATAVGYIGKYGNSHTGWMPVCSYFAEFCHHATVANTLSYIALFFYFVLTVTTAYKSAPNPNPTLEF